MTQKKLNATVEYSARISGMNSTKIELAIRRPNNKRWQK